jgi:hypothetical protein
MLTASPATEPRQRVVRAGTLWHDQPAERWFSDHDQRLVNHQNPVMSPHLPTARLAVARSRKELQYDQ